MLVFCKSCLAEWLELDFFFLFSIKWIYKLKFVTIFLHWGGRNQQYLISFWNVGLPEYSWFCFFIVLPINYVTLLVTTFYEVCFVFFFFRWVYHWHHIYKVPRAFLKILFNTKQYTDLIVWIAHIPSVYFLRLTFTYEL